jgi:hypothetical protein
MIESKKVSVLTEPGRLPDRNALLPDGRNRRFRIRAGNWLNEYRRLRKLRGKGSYRRAAGTCAKWRAGFLPCFFICGMTLPDRRIRPGNIRKIITVPARQYGQDGHIEAEYECQILHSVAKV